MISSRNQELCHNTLELPRLDGISRHGCNRLSVWDDEPRDGEPPHVTLHWDGGGEVAEFLSITPTEARALAVILIMAAEGQERRAETPGASLGSPPPPTPAQEEAVP